MPDTIKRSRTVTFEHTISGLLTKRTDLFNEAERLRDRQAVIKNDVDAIDRVLRTLGYTGDLDAEMPRQRRQAIFGPGGLTRAILDVLRDAKWPMASRDVARKILAANEQDASDRRLMTEHTRRVSRALRELAKKGVVARLQDAAGAPMWRAISDGDERGTCAPGVASVEGVLAATTSLSSPYHPALHVAMI